MEVFPSAHSTAQLTPATFYLRFRDNRGALDWTSFRTDFGTWWNAATTVNTKGFLTNVAWLKAGFGNLVLLNDGIEAVSRLLFATIPYVYGQVIHITVCSDPIRPIDSAISQWTGVVAEYRGVGAVLLTRDA